MSWKQCPGVLVLTTAVVLIFALIAYLGGGTGTAMSPAYFVISPVTLGHGETLEPAAINQLLIVAAAIATYTSVVGLLVPERSS